LWHIRGGAERPASGDGRLPGGAAVRMQRMVRRHSFLSKSAITALHFGKSREWVVTMTTDCVG
jgi:hypothetical protein